MKRCQERRVVDLEEARRRPPPPDRFHLGHATDEELDELERIARRRETAVASASELTEGEAILGACARRAAAGEPMRGPA